MQLEYSVSDFWLPGKQKRNLGISLIVKLITDHTASFFWCLELIALRRRRRSEAAGPGGEGRRGSAEAGLSDASAGVIRQQKASIQKARLHNLTTPSH